VNGPCKVWSVMWNVRSLPLSVMYEMPMVDPMLALSVATDWIRS